MTTVNLSTLVNPTGSVGLAYTSIQTGNYSALLNTTVRLNSTSGSFNVTLPATPADGSVVGVFDVVNKCGKYPVLIVPSGGDKVESDAAGLSVNINGAYLYLVYNSATTNWKIADTYAASYSPLTLDILSPFLLMGA